MISGYFCLYGREETLKRIPGKIKHIALLILYVGIVYLIYRVCMNWTDLPSYFADQITGKGMIKLLLFNEPFIISGHLWFLFALIYIYALFAVVVKFNIIKQACIAAPFLLLVVFILGHGLFLVKNISIESYIYRNFLFEGFPFFMFGYILRCNKQRLAKLFSDKMLIFLIAVGTIEAIAERRIIFREFGLTLGAVMQVWAMFMLAAKNPASCIIKPVAFIGEKYSMFIYLYHYIIGNILTQLIDFKGVYAYLMPITVAAASLICAACYYKIKDSITART